MAWWNTIISAAKSAVNIAVSAVKSVVSTAAKITSNAVSFVKTTISKVTNTAKEYISDKVKEAEEKTEKAKDTAKNITSDIVRIVKDKVDDIKSGVEEAVSNTIDAIDDKIVDVKEVVKKIISAKIKEIAVIQIGPFKKVDVSLIQGAYFFATGKTISREEIIRWEAKALDWVAPVNVISVLLTGKNLDGETEAFGTTEHYLDLALALVMFIPITRIPGIAARVGAKAGSKGVLKTAEKMALKKATPAQLEALLKTDNFKWLLEAMRIDPKAWAKLAPKFSKQAQAVISAALEKQHPRTAFRLFEKALVNNANKIKINLGIPITLPAVKTIAFGLGGIMGVLGMAYGIPFGTSWFAKEGLDEILRFPLRDRIKDYKFNPTPEKLESIRRSMAQMEKSVPVAEALVKSVSWLWPFTKFGWDFYIENLNFELEEMKGEVGLLAVVEELPEEIEAVVRDIIDGDTIDVDLKAINKITNEEISLPEYGTTGHARVRIVGINAPEKSPKGEIVCTGIEIYNVEKEYTDQSRDILLPLNDKKVILKLDPENRADTYGRILAVVDYQGQDIGLRQINDGLACYYFRDPHDKVDDVLYEESTLTAKREGIGMWAGLEDIEKEEDKVKIRITSNPTNAKLFLDDIALHHNTPSDEIELSDVIHLFTLGKHVLSAEKAGLSAMVDIEIVKGDNGTINLKLEAPGEIEEEEIIAIMENHIFERADEVETMVETILDVTMIRRPQISVRKVFEMMEANVIARHYSADNSIRFNKSYWLDFYKKNTDWNLQLEGSFAHELTHEIQQQVIGVEEFLEIYKRDRTEMEDLAKAVRFKVVDKDVRSIWPFKGLTEEEWFAGVPPPEEMPPEEVPVVPIVVGPVKPAEIPAEYTAAQAWALKEAFDKVLVLTEGLEIMSEKEREDLINSFSMYTDGQKEVLNLLWRDLTYYTLGVVGLSADEYIALKEKYRMI